VHPRGGHLRRPEASGRFLFTGLPEGERHAIPRPDAKQFPTRSREFRLLSQASLAKLRDSGGLTDAELAALKAKLIHGWAQALTREARSSVPRRCVPFSPSGPSRRDSGARVRPGRGRGLLAVRRQGRPRMGAQRAVRPRAHRRGARGASARLSPAAQGPRAAEKGGAVLGAVNFVAFDSESGRPTAFISGSPVDVADFIAIWMKNDKEGISFAREVGVDFQRASGEAEEE
jgi:hypothetical protein